MKNSIVVLLTVFVLTCCSFVRADVPCPSNWDKGIVAVSDPGTGTKYEAHFIRGKDAYRCDVFVITGRTYVVNKYRFCYNPETGEKQLFVYTYDGKTFDSSGKVTPPPELRSLSLTWDTLLTFPHQQKGNWINFQLPGNDFTVLIEDGEIRAFTIDHGPKWTVKTVNMQFNNRRDTGPPK